MMLAMRHVYDKLSAWCINQAYGYGMRLLSVSV